MTSWTTQYRTKTIGFTCLNALKLEMFEVTGFVMLKIIYKEIINNGQEIHNELKLFFFSSRRRHTRCSRDWSSDVCSSDLAKYACPVREAGEAARRCGRHIGGSSRGRSRATRADRPVRA